MSLRPVSFQRKAVPAMEGAGVHLHRAFGFRDPAELDPFLLFDDFRNDDPAAYLRRVSPGIRTAGSRRSPMCSTARSSMATRSATAARWGAGDVQWMTAGSGILHQEMPRGRRGGRCTASSFWANLPSASEDDGAALPGRRRAPTSPRSSTTTARGCRSSSARSGAGAARWTASPPIRNTSTSSCRRGGGRRFKVDTYRRAFAYVFEGAGSFRDASAPEGVLLEKEVTGEEVNIRDLSGNRTLVRFGTGDEVTVQAGPRACGSC